MNWGCSWKGTNVKFNKKDDLKTLCQLPEGVRFTFKIWSDENKTDAYQTSDRSVLCLKWNIDNPYSE